MYFEREYLQAQIKSLDLKGVFLVHRIRNETLFNNVVATKSSQRGYSLILSFNQLLLNTGCVLGAGSEKMNKAWPYGGSNI